MDLIEEYKAAEKADYVTWGSAPAASAADVRMSNPQNQANGSNNVDA
jgi:hypothetical protein